MAENAPETKQRLGAPALRGTDSKKSKSGTSGRWKTRHHEAKAADRVKMGTALEVGDAGIWVTFVRGMAGKAVREFRELCDEYGETLYDLKRPGAEEVIGVEQAGQGDEEEIEALVQRELGEMRAVQQDKAGKGAFSMVKTGLECLVFVKTLAPVQPQELVVKMCEDARDCGDPRRRKVKYINRLTPVVDMDKATPRGVERVARRVLAPHFGLADGGGKQAMGDASSTYAVRYKIRKHGGVLTSSQVISQIAGLIDDGHRVDLEQPDKVVLVEVFQLFCGMAVVDGGQWERLKRYNMHQLYASTS
ncbi:hypothetical protein CDD81_5381 [Ophiocordyceps australis]|uniref:THUMP domain-containing protein n=1 Tax=Ophiocordyceps australis TaxID=1399860 RepID=A0A2C5XUC3_9HYPO|nr:hypothetical protein CDD81_5381 [Ophiocordyceps australis]